MRSAAKIRQEVRRGFLRQRSCSQASAYPGRSGVRQNRPDSSAGDGTVRYGRNGVRNRRSRGAGSGSLAASDSGGESDGCGVIVKAPSGWGCGFIDGLLGAGEAGALAVGSGVGCGADLGGGGGSIQSSLVDTAGAFSSLAWATPPQLSTSDHAGLAEAPNHSDIAIRLTDNCWVIGRSPGRTA